MCQQHEQRQGVATALAMLDRALDVLNAADAGELTAAEQADILRALERAQSKHTAARAGVLAAFGARGGYGDDGQASTRAWLRWQTRVTRAAAAGTAAWARRLGAHPVIAAALGEGGLSTSWARDICAWTDRLPSPRRGDADAILAAAARDGADLDDLARLAQEMYERSRHDCPGGDDRDDGFADRGVWLGTTLGGAGRLDGDLAPGCTAALSAVLGALAGKAGPEDTRTVGQRRHDALEEACRRLIAAGMLPSRAGQPTQVQAQITLRDLRNMPGGSQAEAAWLAAQSAQPGWLSGADAESAGCDATVTPVVTGHADPAALERMVEVFLAGHGLRPDGSRECACTCGGCTCRARSPLSPATRDRLRGALLAMAADVLSGPGGLASWLRRSLLPGDAAAHPSLPLRLPLDVGTATPSIPAHLRRAVTTRHGRCAFPGCGQPISACQIHHLTPRSRGGLTTLGNLVPVCTFHHLIAIHRWGWVLRLNPEATTTAISPNGRRVLHSHGPPTQAA